MAAQAKQQETSDAITAAVSSTKTKDTTPRVSVFLPPLEDEGTGLVIDQYEHVTVNGETTLVKRGEHVQVTVPVYLQLRNKFPHL
ncbi:MAG: hypothetical protein SOY30_16090 [Eubacteriales bacterium]|nr:hypothetical protein [Eubacteriales bacterium]